MSAPPRPANIVRVLSLSLGIVVLALVGALFGVPMEAAAPATGVVTSSHLIELRARQSGLVDLKLHPGDELKPGQWIATVRPDELPRINDYLREFLPEWSREPIQPPESQVISAPAEFECWLVLDIRAAPGQRVEAGDLIASIVPIDPVSKKPRDLCVRLEFNERHFGQVSVGQPVRLSSIMYNNRLFGRAAGRIERLEPAGSERADGGRVFYAIAQVEQAPFEMKIGSSVTAEVVTGRRKLVRVILER